MPTPASSSPPASSALDSSHAYRPDVDGLRALAVLGVIAFHASATALPGGFVGVDIFFVISGFLITGLIVKGIEGGNFSFADFYTRRIKRIFPAYMLVAMVTLVVASFLLIPNDYIFYTTSLAASWAFLSNVFFSMLSWGYFGQRTEEFPLLHTWSLSVEEQFYFLFPLVMIGLYRYLRAYVVPALVVFTLVFVTISELKTGEVKTYFLLQSRAHELLIGALTWFLTQRAPMRSTALANFWIAAGMALMIGSMFLFDQDTPFPGINSLYPCIGAALVIYAGRTPNSLTPVLRHRVLVGIGLLSYSLYLWHWPIFSFLRYRRIELSWDVALAAVALAFVLAALTWRFIEQPVRKQRSLRFRRAFVQLYVLPAALFMSVGLYSYVTEGAPLRFPSEMRDLIASYSFERDLGRNCSIRDEDYRRIDLAYLEERCAFGDMNRGRPEVLLMGDSHANHFKPFVEHLSQHARLKAVFHVQGSCYPTDLPASTPGLMQAGATEQSTCQRRNADLLALAGQFRYVVLAGFWSEIPPERFEASLAHVVEQIHAAGATPVVFKDNPYYEPDPSQCILHRQRGWLPANTNCHIPRDYVTRTQAAADSAIDRIAARFPDVLVIDPKQVMCDARECRTHIANVALYKDSNHINAKGAKLLAEHHVAQHGNPLHTQPGQPRVVRTSALHAQ